MLVIPPLPVVVVGEVPPIEGQVQHGHLRLSVSILEEIPDELGRVVFVEVM